MNTMQDAYGGLLSQSSDQLAYTGTDLIMMAGFGIMLIIAGVAARLSTKRGS